MTLHQALIQVKRDYENAPFLYTRGPDGYRDKGFADLSDDAQALAATLLAKGYAGKSILLLGGNSTQWIVADFAVCAYVGVSVAANPNWTLPVLLQSAGQTDCAAAFVSDACAAQADALRERGFTVFSLTDDLPSMLVEGRRLLIEGRVDFPPERGCDELCKIFFSSGTTGMGKAVMLSSRNLFAGFDCLQRRTPLSREDRCYLMLPLYHTYAGIYNLLYPMLAGTALYFSSGTGDIAEEFALVQPTVFSAVPKLLQRFHGVVERSVEATLTSFFGGKLRYLFCGGSTLPQWIFDAYAAEGLPPLAATCRVCPH